ncbi:MAG: hypothetical protein ABSD69_01250 [Candidatus Levyibacteriota bacterium]|jgi:hypothetical protein
MNRSKEAHQSGLIEKLGRENVKGYFLLVAGVFAGIGGLDFAANVVLPALHIMQLNSMDGAAAAGVIAAGVGATSIKI